MPEADSSDCEHRAKTRCGLIYKFTIRGGLDLRERHESIARFSEERRSRFVAAVAAPLRAPARLAEVRWAHGCARQMRNSA